MKASAVPVPGEAFDELLYEVAPEQQARIVATADSTASPARASRHATSPTAT